MTNLLKKFGLIVEHLKTEVFYFNRSQGTFNPPPLDLLFIEGSILWPKNIWVLFLAENYPLTNISISTPTKQCPQSSV